MTEEKFIVRPLTREDREWVAHFLDEHWGSTQLVSRGRLIYGHLLPGFVAEQALPAPEEDLDEDTLDDDETAENPIVKMEKVGLLTYNLEDKICQIITLNSLRPNEGIGTALVKALLDAAKESAIKRVWLTTTNDNLPALRFFQKRGFLLVQVHRNAIIEARRLKPQIPLTGVYNIPIRDELELEMLL